MLETSEIVISPLVIAAPRQSTLSGQDAPRPAVEPAQSGRPAATFANILIEVTLIDQRADAPAAAKTLTLLVEDKKSGRIRTSRGNAALNVDASAEIVREGKIRVMLSLDYNPQDSPDRAAPMPIQQSVTAVLDDGKPLVVSLSADPSSERKVRLELKASIVR